MSLGSSALGVLPLGSGAVAAGGDVTVIATTDALTLTEGAASVVVDTTVNPSTDTLSLVENTATVTVDTIIDCTTAALTLVEGEAEVLTDLNTTVSCSTHTLTLVVNNADISVGEVGGGIKKHKVDEAYKKAFNSAKRRKEQRERLEQSVLNAQDGNQDKPKARLALKKNALNTHGQSDINRIAEINDPVNRQLAIEFHLQQIEFKRRENEALTLLLLAS
jgi:hypothetical protein